eukprot:1712678-Pyramimonas_sp.AAC.1
MPPQLRLRARAQGAGAVGQNGPPRRGCLAIALSRAQSVSAGSSCGRAAGRSWGKPCCGAVGAWRIECSTRPRRAAGGN